MKNILISIWVSPKLPFQQTSGTIRRSITTWPCDQGYSFEAGATVDCVSLRLRSGERVR